MSGQTSIHSTPRSSSNSCFLRFNASLEDVGCWISATPIECLIDPDIDCDRGGKEALVYRKWLGVYVFFMSVCVIFINMMAIIHFVMEQKRKSDRNRLRSGNSDTACRFKMSRCFICVKSCVGKIFKTVKKYACCDECTNTDARANKLGQVMVGNDDSMHRGPPSYDPTTNMLSRSSSDPLPPAPQACLTPLEIMATPTFLDTTAKQQDAGKNGCCGDEENGQNQNRFKPRESLNAVKPPPLGSVQAEGVGDQGLCSWTGAKLRAPPSRSAKGGDSYHFNAAEVRAKIRRESLIALDTQELNDTERKNSTSGEELQSRPSTSRKSRLRQKSNNRGWSLHGRTSAATSSLPVNEEDGNDDVRNEDTNNSVETEAIFQALLYTGCFFLTYIFSATGRMIQMQGKEVPFAILFLARFFLPLQGFFNIMVYMRPHIISLRRSNPDYSWFKAFVVVFKGGGDNDCAGQGQRSSQQPASVANIRRRQKLAERDHNRRMDEIKRKSMVSEDCIAAAAIQAQEADEESGGKDDSVTHTIGEEAFARRSSTADDSYLIEDPPDNKSASVASHRCFLVCSITKRQD